MRHKTFASLAAATLLLASPPSLAPVGADVRVSGTQGMLVVQTNDATLAEILAAVRSAVGLDVKVVGATRRRFTGVYSGPLRRVLARLFVGESYVIGFAPDGMTIRLLGGQSASIAGLSGPVAAWQGSRLILLRRERSSMVTVNEPD